MASSVACALIALVFWGGLAVGVSSPFMPKQSLEILQLHYPSHRLLVMTRYMSKIHPVANLRALSTDKCCVNATGTAALAAAEHPTVLAWFGCHSAAGGTELLASASTPGWADDALTFWGRAGRSCSGEDLALMSWRRFFFLRKSF